MKLAVFGTGGAGGYFGGRLAQAGLDVAFIARGTHLDALRANGLRVDSLLGDFAVSPVTATDNPAEIGPVDFVLLGVKTWQVAVAAQALRPLLGPETAVVPLQNGVEAAGQVAVAIGREHVLGGLARILSFIAGPGHIRHAGTNPYLAFNELDNRPSPRVERLRQAAASAAGMTVEVPADIHAALWAKYLFVTPVGAVGAITRAPAGVFRQLPETRAVLEQAMREILAVAQARGIALTEAAVAEALTIVDGLPPHGTASMQRDILDGKPSELEAQSGAVVRLGAAAGVPVPVNTLIYQCLRPQDLRARGELVFPREA
ncbi:MAG: 2-dehydropantoate 2-reductase [Anaerolineales bacterium]|nr:2-dehydropantoate 2-reductase [Anaerolineales bacterium]